MSVVILEDGSLHYEVLGRGRPVVFLHGWLGSWRYWLPAMQTASASYRCYALDLWGFGDSAHIPACYTLEKQTRLLDDFLLKIGLVQLDDASGTRSGKIAILSHGLGALVAILYARKFPGQVDRLMAVTLPLEANAVAARLRSPASSADLADWLLSREPQSTAVRQEIPRTDTDAVTISMQNLASINFPAALAQVSSPCLVVHGQNDPAVNLPPNEWLASIPGHMHQVTLENCGHFPMLDEPSRFSRLMLDFLALQSGTSPAALQIKDEWKRRVR